MNVMRILRITWRIVIFVFLLILAINNMQSVEFNFLGIYLLKIPLIIMLAIFLGSGLLLGLVYGFIDNLHLKNQIKKLNKQLSSLSPTSNVDEQIT